MSDGFKAKTRNLKLVLRLAKSNAQQALYNTK